jgi:hypothetical protein
VTRSLISPGTGKPLAPTVLAASAGDRITLLHKGSAPYDEAEALYLELVGSRVPLAGEDLALLEALAITCGASARPERVPVRENQAVINKVALASQRPLLVDTVTDVLRLVAAVSGGDVTLETPTRFRSLPRAERRLIMAALDAVVSGEPGEAWRRAAVQGGMEACR